MAGLASRERGGGRGEGRRAPRRSRAGAARALPVLLLVLALLPAAWWSAACNGDGGDATASPTTSPTAGVTRTPAPTATATATGAPTRTATPAATAEPTAAPTTAPTPTATVVTPPPTPPPSPSGPAQVITKGDTSQRAVALTFDAGSDAGYTGQILDTLASHGIRASFGVTGRWAEQNPALVRRIAQEGHHFINHSYDHASFTGFSTGLAPLTQAERWEQLDRTEGIIHDLTGASTKPYFRPPYGDYDASVNADLGARGYAYNVMWTVDSRGWMGISADAIVERVLTLAEPGAVYVFHVGAASQDGPALQRVIDGLRERGYGFATLPAILP